MSQKKIRATPKFWGDGRSPTSGARPSPRWYVINISEFQATLVVKQSIIKLLCRDWEIRFFVWLFGSVAFILAGNDFVQNPSPNGRQGLLFGLKRKHLEHMISLSNQLKEFHPSLKLKSRPTLLLLCYYTISPNYVSSFQDQEISLHSLHCPLVTRWKITATFRKNHSAQDQPTWWRDPTWPGCTSCGRSRRSASRPSPRCWTRSRFSACCPFRRRHSRQELRKGPVAPIMQMFRGMEMFLFWPLMRRPWSSRRSCWRAWPGTWSSRSSAGSGGSTGLGCPTEKRTITQG